MAARVVRLVTLADVGDDADARRVSVSARHEAVLDDGRHVLLLDDRGWSERLGGAGGSEAYLWALLSERDVAETARAVVGPDEPFGGRSQAEMESDHWNTLAETLHAHGVVVEAGELTQLPHDVVLSRPLLARLARRTGQAP
jgi:hypothetical protein